VVAVASGASWTSAAAVWCAWSIGYGASVVAVHRVLAAKRGSRSPWHIVTLAAIMFVIAIFPTLVIALPLVAMSIAVAIWLPSPRRLRTIGMALVAASVASGILAVF
jgi:hypothetical protein